MKLYPEPMPEKLIAADAGPVQQAELDRALDRTLDSALSHAAAPRIPADFAARVVAALPPAPRTRHTAQVGRLASVAAAGVLAVSLFVLAPHAAPTFASFAFDLELLLLAQLAGIGYWLTVRRGV